MKHAPQRKITSTQNRNVQPQNPQPQKPVIQKNNEDFLTKLKFCTRIFDFKNEQKDQQEKTLRVQYLTEFSKLLGNQKNVHSLIMPNLTQVFQMIEANIFRPLPIIKKAGPSEDMQGFEEELALDQSWPHLQPVYEFFLQLIVNDIADVRSLKYHISGPFVQSLLALFDSEDNVERDYLKNILHRVYAKLVPRRKMIRKAVTDTFYTLIHEIWKFNGAAELLDIFASIISGFAVPLRDEHVFFFKTVIIPLHKVQSCQKFHNELLRCSMLFVSKDPSLAFDLILGLLQYWPFASFAKETLFLSELLEVMDVCDITKLDPHIDILFKRLVRCIASPHLQVSDRSMCFFENDFFLSVLRNYKLKIFPLMVPIIAKLVESHWHKLLQDSFGAIKNILVDIDEN